MCTPTPSCKPSSNPTRLSEFRGRTMAIFHMSQVVMTAGAMLFGALSTHCRGAVGGSVNGCRWRADHDRDLPGSAGCPVYPITIKRSGSRPGFPGFASGPTRCDACRSRSKRQSQVATRVSTEASFPPGRENISTQTEDDAEHGHERNQRAAKRSLGLRMAVAA